MPWGGSTPTTLPLLGSGIILVLVWLFMPPLLSFSWSLYPSSSSDSSPPPPSPPALDPFHWRPWDQQYPGVSQVPWCDTLHSSFMASLPPSPCDTEGSATTGSTIPAAAASRFSTLTAWQAWSWDVLGAGPCAYRGSKPTQRSFFRPPPPNATVLLVFAMGPASPLETPAASHTRRSLALYSLRRWALQYHGKLEIAVVGALKEDVDSVAEVAHSGVWGETEADASVAAAAAGGVGGVPVLQPWKAWQEGIQGAAHRLVVEEEEGEEGGGKEGGPKTPPSSSSLRRQRGRREGVVEEEKQEWEEGKTFQWVVLTTDATVGPLTSFAGVMQEMREQDDFALTSLYTSNAVGGCGGGVEEGGEGGDIDALCTTPPSYSSSSTATAVHPFTLAFHRDLFSTPHWLQFWERMPYQQQQQQAQAQTWNRSSSGSSSSGGGGPAIPKGGWSGGGGCGTLTPLVPNQRLVGKGTRGADTSLSHWTQCLSSETRVGLGVGSSLEEVRGSYNPFFPVAALVGALGEGVENITRYTDSIWYPCFLDTCLLE